MCLPSTLLVFADFEGLRMRCIGVVSFVPQLLVSRCAVTLTTEVRRRAICFRVTSVERHGVCIPSHHPQQGPQDACRRLAAIISIKEVVVPRASPSVSSAAFLPSLAPLTQTHLLLTTLRSILDGGILVTSTHELQEQWM
jgi:hypothetical protein